MLPSPPDLARGAISQGVFLAPGIPLLRKDGGYGTTSPVAGPEGRLGRIWGLSLNRLRRMERKISGGLGVAWISGSPKTTQGDLKPSLFFPSTPKGWLEGGESPLKIPMGE